MVGVGTIQLSPRHDVISDKVSTALDNGETYALDICTFLVELKLLRNSPAFNACSTPFSVNREKSAISMVISDFPRPFWSANDLMSLEYDLLHSS